MARAPTSDNTWEHALREIRRRKFRRLFDPFVDLEEDIEYDRPLNLFRGRMRLVLEAKAARERGMAPFRAGPTWSLPVGAGRGRPVSSLGERIPHTRLAVGGHAHDKGPVSAVTLDRYNRRHEEIEQEPVVAIADDRYLNRLERDALDGGVPSALRTNMDPDARVRECEWTARTRHERKAGAPRINIRSERDPDLCGRVAADPGCPPKLRNAITQDLARLRDGKERPKSKIAGEPWIDPDALEVFNQLCRQHGIDKRDKNSAVTFGKPRAGRVYSKWVAELPRELDEEGRQRYLDDMASDLDKRGLAFVLVMHRPDPLNDPRNYHVHLMYSDRPVTRRDDGTYDIEEVSISDYGRGRSKVVHQRQPKLREFSSRGWAQELRQLHVDLCNRQLAFADARGRYHAGKAEDIGIELIERQRKLGAKAARIEAAGVGTIIGVDNALIEWERVDARRQRHYARRMGRIAKLRQARQVGGEVSQTMLDAWYDAACRAEHARVGIEETTDAVEMATSRPRATITKAVTIAGTLKYSWERAGWIERSRDAYTALAKIDADLAPERRLLEQLNADLVRQLAARDAARAAFVGSVRASLQRTHPVSIAPPDRSPSTAHRFIDARERLGVEIERDGTRYTYSANDLADARIAPSAFEDGSVQRRLQRLHRRQQDEIARVERLATARGSAVIGENDTPYMSDLINRWREHQRVRVAIRRRRASRLLWQELGKDQPEFYRAEGPRAELPPRPLDVTDLPSARSVAGVPDSVITLAPTPSGIGLIARVKAIPEVFPNPDGAQARDYDASPRDARPAVSSTVAPAATIDGSVDDERLAHRAGVQGDGVVDRLSAGNADHVARLRALDAYVADYRHEDGHLEVEYQALKAIGVGPDWLRAAGVQQALRSIRDNQQMVVAELARDAGARPLAYAKTGSRFWPRDLPVVNLHRLNFWADDPGFDQETFDTRQGIASAHAVRDTISRAPDVDRAIAATGAELFPDGSLGQRQGPAPVFRDDNAYVRVAAFGAKNGRPTDQLLMLLMLAGQHPDRIELAADGLPMARPGSPDILPALLHPWRNDERVVALVTETVRTSRVAGRPIWPPSVDAAVRGYANRSAGPSSPAAGRPRPNFDPEIIR